MNISANQDESANHASKSQPAKPLRTLLFSTLYPSSARPDHGIFVETRLRHLLSSGEVASRVVAPVPWFPSKNRRFGSWATGAATPPHEIRNGVEVWHPKYALPPKVGMNFAPLLLALGARSIIARLIRETGDFDLIDAHYYYPDGAAAALLAQWFKKPFVVTARGTDLNLVPDYRIPRRWIRWTESRAAASITVCQALMERLLELGGERERIRVLRNGVDLDLFRPLDRKECRAKLGLPDGRWILSVGHLIERKGHHIAIEALRDLPADVRLAIVGDGEERVRLAKLCDSLGVCDRTIFAGARPQAELREWYSAADILVLCSSREGWPNVLLEALACGTPVVATRVWGVPEVVNSPVAGQLFDERKPSALAPAIRAVLSSNISRQSIRQYASAFDWHETTQGQIDVFRHVVRRARTVTTL